MIGLDTKILVRYLTPVQSPKATEPIERRLTEEESGLISVVAKVEMVWVLERASAVRLGRERLAKLGVDPMILSAVAFQKLVRDEVVANTGIAAAAGIKAN